MKKKIISILALIVLILNSSAMILISNAVDVIQELVKTTQEGEKLESPKTVVEIELEKYINFDTTDEESENGEKGVIVQAKVKTGIEYLEGQEYKAIKSTTTKVTLPEINGQKPSRVEVFVRDTKATNGGRGANYNYNNKAGILTITAENTPDADNKIYEEKVENARDEYDVILFYGEECYSSINKPIDLVLELYCSEEINDENIGTITGETKEKYSVSENIGEIISAEYNTLDIYNGYMYANTINPANQYETVYSENTNIIISNKDAYETIELSETNNFIDDKNMVVENVQMITYKETIFDKNNILDILGQDGVLTILKEDATELTSINKDTEADENGKIKITYEENKTNLQLKLSKAQKEGIIEVVNTKVIKPTTNLYSKIRTILNTQENIIDIKEAKSNIDVSLNTTTLVNNVANDCLLTVTLRTDKPEYSLFKNPTISIEMPKDVREVGLGASELIYNNRIFTIENMNIRTNENENKVLDIKLQGSQTQYENSSVIEGTNIQIPLKIYLKSQIESKIDVFKVTYTNENTPNVENKEEQITLLNKNATIIPTLFSGRTSNTKSFEVDGVQIDVIEKVGAETIQDNGVVFERQIIKQIVKITNKNVTTKNVKTTVHIPEEMQYVELKKGGYFYNEERNYYTKEHIYRYDNIDENTIEINIPNLSAGSVYEKEFELKVKDLSDDVEELSSVINYGIKVNDGETVFGEIINTIKQAEISVELGGLMAGGRRDWQFWVDVTNLTDRELNDINLAFEVSPALSIIHGVFSLDQIPMGTVSNTTWTYKIEKLNPKEKLMRILIDCEADNAIENETNTYEVIGNCIAYGNSINTYNTNEVINEGPIEAVKVTMTSDKEEQKIKWNDEITYTIKIENVGRTWGALATYTEVNVKDVIPREFDAIEATYNNFILKKEWVESVETPDIKYISETFTEETKTIDLTNLLIEGDYDEEDAPNINLNLVIPEGKTITIVAKAKLRRIMENVETSTNTVVVEGQYINKKTASLSNFLCKYDYIEETDNPDDPDNPDNPNNPDNPDKPDDPNNPNNPDNPTKNTYSISGIAWIDENEDGKRSTDEKTYKDMSVALYNYIDNTFVKENNQIKTVRTNEYGEYKFTDINKGKYIVVFLYDDNKYILTEYKKDGVIENKNNDAISKKTNINGEYKTAGLTDIIIVESNISNIDIGLIEIKEFDLEIQKYISKVTVQTSQKTKTYDYNNKQFAKVEIHRKQIEGATVIIEYKMVITNKGELEGKAVQIVDKLPEDLKFHSELNKDWYENKGELYTASLTNEIIKPGESREIKLILTKEMTGSNTGTTTNTAKISVSSNGKAIEDKNAENDTSKAELIIGTSTGIAKWLGITFGTIALLILTAFLIIKKKIKIKGLAFIFVFVMSMALSMQQYVVKAESVDIHLDVWGGTSANGGTYTCISPGMDCCTASHVGEANDFLVSSSEVKTSDTNEGLSIWNETNGGSVRFSSINESYNSVGPFRVNSSHSTDSKSATVHYIDCNGNYGNFSTSDFNWGQDFYLTVSKSIIRITGIDVSGSYDYEIRYLITNVYGRTVSPSASGGGHSGAINNCQSGVQSFALVGNITRQTERVDTGTCYGSTQISGVWTAPGNLQIIKVDANNTGIRLSNVEFKLAKYAGTGNSYMMLTKDGAAVSKIQGDIVLTGYSYPGDQSLDNPSSAVVNGITYGVTFTASIGSATTIVTDGNGQVTVSNLRCGQYTVYEVASNNYGYTLNIHTSTMGMVACGTMPWYIANQKQTGNIYIKKVDSRNPNKVLPNVEFVLRSYGNGYTPNINKYIKIKLDRQNEYAKRVVGMGRLKDVTLDPNAIGYVDDINEATVFVTDGNGELKICNILTTYNSYNGVVTPINYHFEEIKNPNYGYLSNISNYNNYRVTFDAKAPGGWMQPWAQPSTQTSGTYNFIDHNSTIIKNEQIYVRLSGFVWEDIAFGKDNSMNNQYNTENGKHEPLIEGIKVYLYKDGYGLIDTKITDTNGYYEFGTNKGVKASIYTNSDYGKLDGAGRVISENGNLIIDDLDKYYIEFEYDGLIFTTAAKSWDYTKQNETGSKAEEVPSGRPDQKDRYTVNKDMSEITFNTSRDINGNINENKKYDLGYTFNDHKSTYIETESENLNYWKYEYSEDKQKLKVTYDYEKNNTNDRYEIISSTRQSGYSIKTKWEGAYKTSGSEVIANNNQGLYRREQPDLAVSSDIFDVNVIVNGYENTYTYEGRRNYITQTNTKAEDYNEETDGFGIGVKFGKLNGSYSNRGLNMYSRPIYRTDLALYNSDENKTNDDLMQVYVTYKIRIANQATGLYAKVNELVNYYDSRYELKESWIGNKADNQLIKDSWTNEEKYGATYTDSEGRYIANYTQALKDIEIEPLGYRDIYIKFRVKVEAIRDLVNKQATLNNVTEIVSYSTGTKDTGNWKAYAGIDKDSNPGSAKIEPDVNINGEGYKSETIKLDMISYEDDTDFAPSFVLDLAKEEGRGLSGVVFEDKTSEETKEGQERLGDGIHTSDEKVVYNAKVELIETDASGKIIWDKDAAGNIIYEEDGTTPKPKLATLYKLGIKNEGTSSRTVTTEKIPAVVYTNEKGEYEFVGVITGMYLIRYTYDGSSYILKPSETYEIKDSVPYINGNKLDGINVRDYKSTIITSEVIKNALQIQAGTDKTEYRRMGDLNWIVKYEPNGKKDNNDNALPVTRFSDAVDDLDMRGKIADMYYGLCADGEQKMNAYTAVFDVGVEFNTVNTDKKSWTDYRDEFKFKNDVIVFNEQGNVIRQSTFYAVNPYQDFGIVERARQDIKLNKTISKVKIVLASGQILLEGDPYHETLPYLKAVPGLVMVEMDSELIQGARLELEYEITVENHSEMDYEYRWKIPSETSEHTWGQYYFFGKNDVEKAKEVKTVIQKVIDYMDEDIVYDARTNDIKENEYNDWSIITAGKLAKYNELIELDDENSGTIDKRLISEEVEKAVTDGYTIAITESFLALPIGQAKTIPIYASKLLASNAKGIDVTNHAEIIQTTGVRRILNSTPGNYNPRTQSPDEQDDDRIRFIITPPTGNNLDIKLALITAVAILIVLAIGVVIIKKTVLGDN